MFEGLCLFCLSMRSSLFRRSFFLCQFLAYVISALLRSWLHCCSVFLPWFVFVVFHRLYCRLSTNWGSLFVLLWFMCFRCFWFIFLRLLAFQVTFVTATCCCFIALSCFTLDSYCSISRLRWLPHLLMFAISLFVSAPFTRFCFDSWSFSPSI